MNMQNLFQSCLLLQVNDMTPARGAMILPVVLGLTSSIIGWLAIVRSSGRIGSRRPVVIAGLVFAVIGVVLSGLHLIFAPGDIGTASGRLGAIVAQVLGLIGIVLCGVALTRSRRITTESRSKKND
jgi:hypothetical protein